MSSLTVMQSYADKCAGQLSIDCKPLLRWQTPDCKLHKYANAHCHIIDDHPYPSAPFPRGTVCLSRKRMPAKSIKGWHYTIAHEVAHLAVKSNHSTATFARRMVSLGVANHRDKDTIQREKHIRKFRNKRLNKGG